MRCILREHCVQGVGGQEPQFPHLHSGGGHPQGMPGRSLEKSGGGQAEPPLPSDLGMLKGRSWRLLRGLQPLSFWGSPPGSRHLCCQRHDSGAEHWFSVCGFEGPSAAWQGGCVTCGIRAE